MVGQRTPYCENFEYPCENEHDVVDTKTGLCPNKKRAKCIPLHHFACETYENVIKEYAPSSKKRKRLNKVLGINIRDKIDESKVDTTDSMYQEYQKIWGLLNSIEFRNECAKRKKIFKDASWISTALPKEECT